MNGRDAEPLPNDLLGSVKPYRYHIALCTGGPPELWAARVEEMEGTFAALHAPLTRRGLGRAVKLTACDTVSLSDEGIDALLLPTMVRLPALSGTTIEPLVDALEDDLRGGFPFEVRPMPGGDHLFVCVHGARDSRCGEWGAAVAEAFEREIERQGAIATLHRSSHIGGHKYAATCILYPHGLWYGNLRPQDVPRFVSEQLHEEQLLPEFYRGRAALSFAAQVVEGHAAQQLKQRYGRFDGLELSFQEDDSRGKVTGQARAHVLTEGGSRTVTLEVTLTMEEGRWHLVRIK